MRKPWCSQAQPESCKRWEYACSHFFSQRTHTTRQSGIQVSPGRMYWTLHHPFWEYWWTGQHRWTATFCDALQVCLGPSTESLHHITVRKKMTVSPLLLSWCQKLRNRKAYLFHFSIVSIEGSCQCCQIVGFCCCLNRKQEHSATPLLYCSLLNRSRQQCVIHNLNQECTRNWKPMQTYKAFFQLV